MTLRVVTAPRHTCKTKGLKSAIARQNVRASCPACELDRHLGSRRSSPVPGVVVPEHVVSSPGELCPSCGHSHPKNSLCTICKAEGRVCGGYPLRK